MTGIYLTAILTSVIAAVIFGPLIHKLRMPADERLVWLAAAIALPMQPLAFYCVRMPFDHWLVGSLGSTSTTYLWLTSLYAPLTEEPAKLIPLLIPAIYRDIRPTNVVRYALAIGAAFAIGEMWFIAERIARVPEFSTLPFYQFAGYATERLLTCLFHSAFVSLSLWCLRRRFALGFAGACALHWLGNIPILLMAMDVGGLGKTVWLVLIAQIWMPLLFIGSVGLLSYFTFDRIALGRVFYGIRHCPECEADYDAPLFAVNLVSTRYERCPHCQKWHWTTSKKG